MARKRHTAEEIVSKLRQVDALMAQGRPVADSVRAIAVTEVTYYRWRNEYGGLEGDQVKRLGAGHSYRLDLHKTQCGIPLGAPYRDASGQAVRLLGTA